MSQVILDCIGFALDGNETDNYSPRPRKTYRAGCNFVFRRREYNGRVTEKNAFPPTKYLKWRLD